MKNRKYLVALSAFTPFGPKRIKLLVSYFKTAQKVWLADAKKLIAVGLSPKITENFLVFRREFDFQKYFQKLEKLKIQTICYSDKNFPENLKELDDAPVVLYVKGKITGQDANAVAIVGSRKMTAYGREVAERFGGELAGFGVTIISGLARGIDTIAHKSALGIGGRTIAVLGCGLDSVYPPENFGLAREIVLRGGALISEYALGYPALRINFASRNRIISGLAKAVLVVEGAIKSGTLLTASSAAEQGRSVFAVPGQIYSPLSGAPLFLIKNGAKMAVNPRDILEDLDIDLKVDREKMEKILPASKNEGTFLEILANEPLHLDEIARISSFAVSEVSARLTMMELKGLVKNLGGGVYKKV